MEGGASTSHIQRSAALMCGLCFFVRPYAVAVAQLQRAGSRVPGPRGGPEKGEGERSRGGDGDELTRSRRPSYIAYTSMWYVYRVVEPCIVCASSLPQDLHRLVCCAGGGPQTTQR